MRTLAASDLERAMLDPASVFGAPRDVVGAVDLTPAEKRAILIRWEADAEALLRATEEGMETRSPAELLRAVHEARERLDAGSGQGRKPAPLPVLAS
jgi:hypothetical protein